MGVGSALLEGARGGEGPPGSAPGEWALTATRWGPRPGVQPRDRPARLAGGLSEAWSLLPRDVHTRVCVCVCVCVCVWNHVWLFATPWTAAHQAPLSVGAPGKNTAVGHHALLQRLFPTQGSILRLPHCRRVLYRQSPRDARESAALTLGQGALRPGFCSSSSGLRLAERGGARSRLGLSLFISRRAPPAWRPPAQAAGRGAALNLTQPSRRSPAHGLHILPAREDNSCSACFPKRRKADKETPGFVSTKRGRRRLWKNN